MTSTRTERNPAAVSAPPALTAVHHVGITVTDVERSLAWYEEMLGMVQWMTETWEGGWTACITRPGSDVHLGLDTHQRNEGERFGPHRTGLDHVSLATTSRAELDAWFGYLTGKGVACSPIVEATQPVPYALFTFTDPDRVALEIIHMDAG